MQAILTREQVRQVDRIAAEEYHISGLVLMENAGHNAARIILQEMGDRLPERGSGGGARVLFFCGTGNNGGDGFVIARHLDNAGINVAIALAGEPDRLSPDAAANHRICVAMGLSIVNAQDAEIRPRDLVVDALLGTGFRGDIRQPLAGIIDSINQSTRMGVVAVDVPSGLECNTGQPANACIRADLTITFVADKAGFQSAPGREYVGRVRVADIGAPPAIVQRVLSA
jgi:NAD(P)H-hydrate epimerase